VNTWTIVLLVILVIVIAALIALYVVGSKLQKKSEASQAQMKIGAQTMSMLVIDKKRMKLTEANLPKIVVDQTPKYLRRSKVPIVKAKVGPKVLTMICDEKIFDLVPVKKEVKAVVNGIYIMDVKGLRTNLDQKPEKLGFFKKMTNKITKKSSK
jgi:type II secretory pathway pseudopilin PulG